MRALLLALALASNSLAAEPPAAAPEPLKVAVAANFRQTLEQLADQWVEESGSSLQISSASTGVLYSQAVFGAPFDLLLAADSERPRKLVEAGHAMADSLTTYAYGVLVLAYRDNLAEAAAQGIEPLLAGPGLSVAIANPELAPYGRAAAEVLDRHSLDASSRLLTATNVSQAFQMWRSGGADLALVAASYRPVPSTPIPASWYSPIAQQAVILGHASGSKAARSFLTFLTSEAARSIIEADGYLTAVADD